MDHIHWTTVHIERVNIVCRFGNDILSQHFDRYYAWQQQTEQSEIVLSLLLHRGYTGIYNCKRG